MRTSLLLLIIACGADEPPPPADPGPAIARITATVQEAGRLDVAGQDEDARTGWRRAHAEFEAHVEPALRTVMSPVEVAEIEMRFGLFRSAIEQNGSSRSEASELVAALHRAQTRLPASP